MLRLAILALAAAPAAAADVPPPVGTRAPDFTLNDTSGQPWNLVEKTRGAKATVVVFLGTACPVSNAYLPRLNDLAKKYAPEGVTFVGVNAVETDTAADVAEHAKANGLRFPVLKDAGTATADKLHAERVPTAFVFDGGRTVRYKGRIDDQFRVGVHKGSAATRELGNAIDAVLEGKDVRVPHVAASGCLITREKPVVATSDVTYHKHVSRIVQAKCQECHRAGEAAPFALTEFKHAKGWAGMIREVVADDVMPPWHADAPRGHFKNDRRLSADEKKTLLAWIDAGCPEGDPKDAPPAREYLKGWRLPRVPDDVLAMKRLVQVPASVPLFGMQYQYIEVGEPFAEDKWVTGCEVRPEYREVVHHIIAFILEPGMSIFDLGGEGFGAYMLGAYVPGDQPIVLPPGYARKVKKGSRIVFELHYTPNGRAGADRSMVGLTYSKEPPKHEMFNLSVMNGRFRIPPGAANHQVPSQHTFDKPARIVSLTPHMHLRGKAFKYEAVYPDGKRTTLLNVPKYDFNWQASYDFADPPTLPAGSRIECTAWFDNSKENPFNPDPSKTVRWGNQTWEEMMIGFVMYHDAK